MRRSRSADVEDEPEEGEDGQDDGVAAEEAEVVLFGPLGEFPVGVGE